MAKRKTKAITFKIGDIKVTHFRITNSLNLYTTPKDHEYTFEMKIQVLINQDIKSVAIETSINIFKDKEKSDSLCQLVVFVAYEIKEFEDVVHKENNDLKMDPTILRHFISNNIGVSRGILYTKTQGTFLQNVYLPPFDINELLK